MEYQIGGVVIRIVQGDITLADTEAIVNAANSALAGGGGVDGAIHAAGGPAIAEECARIREARGSIKAGETVITTGGRLKAKYVIHTVGPVWRGGTAGEPEKLAACYANSLKLAVAKGLKSVAFPAISTGVYGYPIELAAPVALGAAVTAARAGELAGLEEIRYVLYTPSDYAVYVKAMQKLAGALPARS